MLTTAPSLSPLLEWLPDETLFSLCSRFHHLSGHRTPARSCRELFGSERAGSAHDTPALVRSLVNRFPDLGSVHAIIQHHTLLPFYFPFHKEINCLNWIEQVSTGTAPSLKAQLGLAASRFGAAHPLKSCPQCMKEDAALQGVAYWHVAHQIPAVLVCPIHKNPLLISTQKSSGKDRFAWLLPAQTPLAPMWETQEPHPAALHLTEASLALRLLPLSFTFDQTRLTALYRSRLLELGLMKPESSRVDHVSYEDALRKVLNDTGMASVWPWLIDAQGVPTISARLLRLCHSFKPRQSRHPLNHLPLVLLLFGSWRPFLSEYQRFDRARMHASPPEHPRELRHSSSHSTAKTHARETLLRHIADGMSPTRAAELCGIAVATAMTWMADTGIRPAFRPKLLKQDERNRLIKMLARGAEKSVAAANLNVSVQTITRVLLTEPGLHDLWSARRFYKAQTHARSAWIRALNAFPQAASNLWRNLEPAAYSWLYRHDRIWLRSTIRERPEPVPPASRRRDWDQRDLELSRLVRATALEWFTTSPTKHLTLAQLCASARGLRSMLPAMQKLPLTRAAIQHACTARHPMSSSSLQMSIDEGFKNA